MLKLVLGLLALAWAGTAAAQTDYGAQLKEGDAVLRDFRFGSGERIGHLISHYATLGTPRRDGPRARLRTAVMVLHGTGGSGRQFLHRNSRTSFVRAGPAARHESLLLILPDASGTAIVTQAQRRGTHAFPKYDYDDMVEAQRRMLVEGLGVRGLRLMMGTRRGLHAHLRVVTKASRFRPWALIADACLPTGDCRPQPDVAQACDRGDQNDPASWAVRQLFRPAGAGLAHGVIVSRSPASRRSISRRPMRRARRPTLHNRPGREGPADPRPNDLIYQLRRSRTYNPWPRLERIRAPRPGSTSPTTSSTRRLRTSPRTPRGGSRRPATSSSEPPPTRAARHSYLGEILAAGADRPLARTEAP